MIAFCFFLLVCAVALAHVLAAGVSGRRLKHPKARLQRDLSITVVAVMVVLGVTAAVSAADLLANFDSFPPPALPFFLFHFLATIGLGLSAYGRRLADGLPVWALIGYQAFRIPVELTLHALYLEGRIPVQMTYVGLNFDIVTGLTAIPVAWLAWKGRLTRVAMLAWNTLGLLLLANIVTIAILSMPTTMRVFMNHPPNTFVAEMPYTWLPTFLVTSALLGHVLVYRVKSGRGSS